MVILISIFFGGTIVFIGIVFLDNSEKPINYGSVDLTATSETICAQEFKLEFPDGVAKEGFRKDYIIPLALGGLKGDTNIGETSENQTLLKDKLTFLLRQIVCLNGANLRQAQEFLVAPNL